MTVVAPSYSDLLPEVRLLLHSQDLAMACMMSAAMTFDISEEQVESLFLIVIHRLH